MIAGRIRRERRSLARLSLRISCADTTVRDLRLSRGLVGAGWLVRFIDDRTWVAFAAPAAPSVSVDPRLAHRVTVARRGDSGNVDVVRGMLSATRTRARERVPDEMFDREIARGSYVWSSLEPNSGDLVLRVESGGARWLLTGAYRFLRLHVRAGDEYAHGSWGDVRASWGRGRSFFPTREMMSDVGAVNFALLH